MCGSLQGLMCLMTSGLRSVFVFIFLLWHWFMNRLRCGLSLNAHRCSGCECVVAFTVVACLGVFTLIIC